MVACHLLSLYSSENLWPQVCKEIENAPLCEVWYAPCFRGVSGRIGDCRTVTGLVCSIGAGYGQMQTIQAESRACGNVRTLLEKAGRERVVFLGIEVDYKAAVKYRRCTAAAWHAAWGASGLHALASLPRASVHHK